MKFKLIDDPIKLKIKSRNLKRVLQLNYEIDKAVHIDELLKKLDTERKLLIKKGYKGRIELATHFVQDGWRNGKFRSINDKIDAYDEEALEHSGGKNNNVSKSNFNWKVDKFTFYLLDNPAKAGGNSVKNDCLYQCLLQAVQGDRNRLPEQIRSAKKLKEFLGLDREDKIDIEYIGSIEKLFKGTLSLNVFGDYTYTSGIEANRNANIRLYEGHYQLKCNEGRSKTLGFYKRRSKESVRTYYVKGSEKWVYDGVGRTKVDYDTLKSMLDFKANYLMLKSSDSKMESDYDEFIRIADGLDKVTNKKYSLYNYKDIPTFCFDTWSLRMSKSAVKPDPLSVVEQDLIRKTFRSGILYLDPAFKGYKGYGKILDINSMYPYLMQNAVFELPVKEGTPKILTDISNYKSFSFGFYHAKVGDHKFFKQNEDDWYTHHDLNLALELKLDIELIQNEQCNFYAYGKEARVKGHDLFYEYISYFFDLKQAGFNDAKKFMSPLWGKMMEKNYEKKYFLVDEDMDLEDREIVEIKPCNMEDKKGVRFIVKDAGMTYKSEWARVGSFLTSYSRLFLLRQILPYLDNVVRIATDSILVTTPMEFPTLELSKKMGDFKLEFEGQIKIDHVLSVKKF